MGQSDRAGRLRRILGAAALAFVVVGGPVAGQASAAELDSFSGMGTGFALRVTVDLSGLPDPAKLAIQQAYAPVAQASNGLLPAQFPFVIDQKFIETLAEMGAAQTAESILGEGFRNFDSVASVTKTGEKTVVTAAEKLPSEALPVLDVSVGELVASITDGPDVKSTGTITNVSAGLEGLMSVLPADLETALSDVTDAVNGAIDTLNTSLDTQLPDVADTLADTTDPILGGLLDDAGLGGVLDDPAALTTELQNLVTLPDIGSLLSGDIANVSGLKNTSTTENKDGTIVSEATSRLAGVNVLGLVRAGVINLESKSVAAGTEGSAENTSSCSIADLRVGGSNGVSLDGENIYVNGTALPVPADLIGTVDDLVGDVLSTAGLSVELCDDAQAEADKDGTSAAQRVSAFRIELAPKAVADVAPLGISAGDELFKIVIDPTVETSVAAQVATETEPSLPRTGAGPIATVMVGVGLAGAALLARKRFITN